jgi:hypothetical protein
MNRPALPLVAVVLSTASAAAQIAPVADHHQHLFSPAIAALLATGAAGQRGSRRVMSWRSSTQPAFAARLWFDVATIADSNISAANAALAAKRIRQVGVERILYGSDAAAADNLRPREGWAAFRRLPLTDGEFEKIARNEAPYLH